MENNCDPLSRTCSVPEFDDKSGGKVQQPSGIEVVYIGDPMCSWCWGISPVVAALPDYCSTKDIRFSIVVGGLRPGGGVPWTDGFKNFLHHHWHEVGIRSGQPFSDALFQLKSFDYDTEPACRAIVTARFLLKDDINSKTLSAFLSSIQHKFYAEGADPKEADFYRAPCETSGISFDAFLSAFDTPAMKEHTLNDFKMSRDLGVRGFPSFAFRDGERAKIISSGFIAMSDLTSRIETILNESARQA